MSHTAYEQARANVAALLGPRPDPILRIRFDTPDHEQTNATFRADIQAQMDAARLAAPRMEGIRSQTEDGIRNIAATLARLNRFDRALAWDRAVKAECRRLEAGERIAA